MSTFYFADIPFDLPNDVQIAETVISEGFKSYNSVNPSGNNISFSLTRIGDQFWTYSGDINLSATQIGDSFTSFSGDISGSVTNIGGIFSGMEDERKDYLFEIFDSKSAVLETENNTANPDTGTFEWQGTAGDDDISTFDLYRENLSYNKFKLNGGEGDDRLSLSIMGRIGADSADGGDGDDFMAGAAYLTSYASAVFKGGFGNDKVYFSGATITSISRNDFSTEVVVINNNDGSELNAVIMDDVESFSYQNELGDSVTYLTEDIANGRNRAVEWSELYARTYGDNADWYIKNLDTYTEYHSPAPTQEPTPAPVQTPTPEPTPAPVPTPTPEPIDSPPEPTQEFVSTPMPEPEPYDGIIESVRGKGKLKGTKVADAFTFDSFEAFTKKSADKIIGFKPSQGDTIAVSPTAFPGLKGVSDISFASTRSKKELQQLSKEHYDFVYFEKKGRLYFDGNGAEKNWGNSSEGGLVAILKGKPELTAEDITLLA
ncbi:metallopeptidase [Synechococcus sp. RS9915]|nr:metallopeptidase [Synechococcus sp. RS9915]